MVRKQIKKTSKAKVESKNDRLERAKRDDAPTGIKIISILHYVYFVFWFMVGLLVLIGVGKIREIMMKELPEMSMYSPEVVSLVLIFGGILVIAISILHFFIARGLWRLQNWARILVIILAIIGIVNAISGMIIDFSWLNIVNLVVDSVIAWYLLFAKEAKYAFKK